MPSNEARLQVFAQLESAAKTLDFESIATEDLLKAATDHFRAATDRRYRSYAAHMLVVFVYVAHREKAPLNWAEIDPHGTSWALAIRDLLNGLYSCGRMTWLYYRQEMKQTFREKLYETMSRAIDIAGVEEINLTIQDVNEGRFPL